MNISDIKKYYDDLYKAQSESIKSDTEKALKEFNSDKQQLNKSIDNANRALYGSYTKAQRNLPAQLARQGISGGASESASISLSADYMDSLASNEQLRNTKISEIDNSIASLRESSRSALAELRAQNALDKYNAVKAAEQQAAASKKQAESDNYSKQLKKAQTLANYGDFSGYAELGWNTSAMQSYADKQKAESEWEKDLEWAVFMAEKFNDYDALYELVGRRPSNKTDKTDETKVDVDKYQPFFPEGTNTSLITTPPGSSLLWLDILKKKIAGTQAK